MIKNPYDRQRVENAINWERKKGAKDINKLAQQIKHFYPHSQRHTFAIRCFEAGIDAKTVQNYRGHASIAILWTYIHMLRKIRKGKKWTN